MMAFDHVFLEVARAESRAIETTDRAGRSATFLFREFYCTEPGCDCRRVVLHVHWVEEKRVAASINYAFEPSRRRNEPQISLNPLNPQSEYSAELLAVFGELLAKDREYRKLLVRHYAMWKQVVDDPTHPDHAKVRGDAHDDPSFRPVFPRRKPSSPKRPAATGGRTANGGPAAGGAANGGPAAGRTAGAGPANGGPAGGAPAGSNSLELVAAKGAQADSKLQQRFRRLLQKVDHLKQRVRAWKTARPDIDTEISLYAALLERMGRLDRDLVALLERSYQHPMFSKADRKKLGELICSLAGDLIESGGHDDLKPLYNSYSRSDFDAEAAVAGSETAEAVRAMMEVFGVEFGDADVGSLDKLQAFTEAQLRAFEEESAAEEARRARRKKSAKQVAAEARREEAARSTGKALQEVYRGLAMALHPDREQDPAERARKTEVMREVNTAYEAKDLLRLLELQLELERVDPARAGTIAEERLRHYNQILDDQAKQLAIEVDDVEMPFRMELGLASSARLAPTDVIARIRVDAEAVKQQIAARAKDLKTFEDVARLKAWLRTRPGPRARSAEPDLGLFR